jgi:hypothetical protein
VAVCGWIQSTLTKSIEGHVRNSFTTLDRAATPDDHRPWCSPF